MKSKRKYFGITSLLTIGGKTVFCKTWVSKGILRIKDILNAHDNFLSFQDLKDTFNVRCTFLITVVFLQRFLKIGKMLSHMAIRHTPTNQRQPTVTQSYTTNRWKCFNKICSTIVCWEIFLPPLIESYLKEQTFTPSAVYELPFKITIENKLRSFQFKLIHNILPTNAFGKRMLNLLQNANNVMLPVKLLAIYFKSVLP